MSGKAHICPIDRRQFATANALAQHRRDAHSAGARTSANRSTAASNALSLNVVSGSDLLPMTLISDNTRIVGGLLMNISVSPSALSGTRLAQQSSLWARWRPRSLRLSLAGSAPLTVGGSVAVGWSPDSTWTKGDPFSDLMRVSALKPSIQVKLSGTGNLNIPMETTRKWYHCSGNYDEASHGSIVMVLSAPPVGINRGQVNILSTLHWSIEFEGLNMPSTAAQHEDIITPDSGWENLFTTSSSDWDAERLTFKEHSGGSIVTFSAARFGVYYKPLANVTVPYVKEDGSTGIVEFLVRVQSYSAPILAFCASEADAKSYVTTGDIAKLIKYKAAGRLVTPPIPRFRASSVELDVHKQLDVYRNLLDRLTCVDRMAGGEPKFMISVADTELRNIVRKGYEVVSHHQPIISSGVDYLTKNTTGTRGSAILDPLYVVTVDPVKDADEDGASGTSGSFEVVPDHPDE